MSVKVGDSIPSVSLQEGQVRNKRKGRFGSENLSEPIFYAFLQ